MKGREKTNIVEDEDGKVSEMMVHAFTVEYNYTYTYTYVGIS